MQKHAGLAVLVFLTTVGSQYSLPSAKTQETAPALEEILDRMEQAHQPNQGPHQPYTVTREYGLSRDDHQPPISKVTAEISSIVSGKKQYEIKRASGNGIGKKVVLKILDWETHSIKDDSTVSRRNYNFSFLREESLEGYPTYVLGIVPKRKEKDLFNGEVWVDAHTFRVRRIEGSLARKPSWWVKRHYIVLQFAEEKGIWIHTSMKVTAVVRIFGKYVLTAKEVDVTLLSSVASLTHVLRTLSDGSNIKSLFHVPRCSLHDETALIKVSTACFRAYSSGLGYSPRHGPRRRRMDVAFWTEMGIFTMPYWW